MKTKLLAGIIGAALLFGTLVVSCSTGGGGDPDAYLTVEAADGVEVKSVTIDGHPVAIGVRYGVDEGSHGVEVELSKPILVTLKKSVLVSKEANKVLTITLGSDLSDLVTIED